MALPTLKSSQDCLTVFVSEHVPVDDLALHLLVDQLLQEEDLWLLGLGWQEVPDLKQLLLLGPDLEEIKVDHN